MQKIGGERQVKVEYRAHEDYWVISKITFIGDQILRAEKNGILQDLIKIATINHGDDWHCVIKDGSNIIW